MGMSTIVSFINKFILSDILHEYLSDDDLDQLYYVYNLEEEDFELNNSTLRGIPVFNSRELNMFLEAHLDHLEVFTIFKPNEQLFPDTLDPIIIGKTLVEEINAPD